MQGEAGVTRQRLVRTSQRPECRAERRACVAASLPQLIRCNGPVQCSGRVGACVRACGALRSPCAYAAAQGSDQARVPAGSQGRPHRSEPAGARRRERGGGAGRPGVRGVARTMVDTPR